MTPPHNTNSNHINKNRDALSRRCHVSCRIYNMAAAASAEVTSLTAHSRPHMHGTRSQCRAPTHPPTAHYYCQARQEVRESEARDDLFCVCVPRPIKENLAWLIGQRPTAGCFWDCCKRQGGRADLLFVGAAEVGGCGMFINGACGGIESFPLTNDSRRRFWFYLTQKFVFEVNWQSQFVDIYVHFLSGMCNQKLWH